MRSEASVFSNSEGRVLFGIWQPAMEDRKNICVVLLSPGIKNRVAPHRLYVKLGNHLQANGYDVFRFDPEGLGDSEGEFNIEQIADLYGAIQLGQFTRDTAAALDWVESNKGATRFILGGLCGGAIAGMIAGADDSRVVGLLSLGIPVVLDSSDPAKARFTSRGQLTRLRNRYFWKLLKPKSWLRVFTFRTNFSVLWKALIKPFEKEPGPDSSEGSPIQLNPVFADSYERFAAGGRPMLLLFGGTDRLLWEFEELFASRHERLIERYQDMIDRVAIDGANHILSFREWQEEMFNHVDRWLAERFSG